MNTTNNRINKSFEDVYDEAMIGAKINKNANIKNFFINFLSNPYVIIIIFFIIVIFIRYLFAIILTIFSNFLENIFPNNNYEYEKSIKKLKIKQ